MSNWKLIDLYNDFNANISDYEIIAVEMHGVKEVEHDGLMYAEQDDENPEYYSVYVRQVQGTIAEPFNPLICIADLADKDDAEAFADFIRKLLKLPVDDSRVR